MKCKVLKDNSSRRLKGAGRRFKYIPWKIIAKNRMNEVIFLLFFNNSSNRLKHQNNKEKQLSNY